MRRLLKFLHTVGAIGLMGSMASLVVVLSLAPAPTSVAGQVAMMGAMGKIASWVLLPSLVLTLLAGLLAMAATPGYHDVGWVWVKAATGLLIFEGGFVSVIGPIQAAAKNGADVLAGRLDPAIVARSFDEERNTLWVLLAIALLNVALGVWRPRLPQYPV